MKNSAWYHKLWLKKLNQFPVKENVESSWAEMQALLNEHLPTVAKKPSKFSGGTVVSMLGFILPAAAMIAAITFVAVKHPFKSKALSKQHDKVSAKDIKGSYHRNDSLAKTQTFLNTDSGGSITANNRNRNTTAPGSPDINNQATVSVQGNHVKSNNTGRAALSNPAVYPVKGNSHGKNIRPNQPKSENQRRFPADSITVNQPITTSAKLAAVNNKAFFTRPLTGFDSIWGTGLIRRLAASKAASAGGFSKITVKAQNSPSKNRKINNQNDGANKIRFGIEGLANTSGAGTNLVLGLFGTVPLNQKWKINAGAWIDLNRPLSGTITHASYARPDTLGFKVTDSRKVNTISVPITLEYKVSNRVSVHAGPQLSFSAGQSTHSNKLQPIANFRDTASHSHSIDSALKYNSISKFNIGISGGVSIRVSPHFYIEGLYQQNITPYKVNTGLGNYNQYYHSVQLGIRYTFKKEK